MPKLKPREVTLVTPRYQPSKAELEDPVEFPEGTPPEIEVCNPRYQGATPEMVARALARHQPKPEDDDDEET